MSKKKVVNKKVVNEEFTNNSDQDQLGPKESKEVKVEPKVVKKPIEPSIFDKYRKHIDTVKEGYLKKLTYSEAIEILRYVQDKTGHKLGLNMSCSTCLVELVEIFMRLEDK